MATERLSALDATFLAVESAAAPMHVGWVATFEPPADAPRPGYEELSAHIAARLAPAPRYRQKLAAIPFGLHEPLWVDDEDYDPAAHVLHAPGDDLDAIVDAIFSTPLPRDRPLWQMWIADELPGGQIALVGKAHHCMVDGTAVVELGKLLLDAAPDAADPEAGVSRGDAPTPPAAGRLARAAADRATETAALALAPLRLGTRLPGAAGRGARVLSHMLLPPAPGSELLNRPGSARRHHVRVTRPLEEIRAVRRQSGVTPNDVVLAACAGALRRFAERRGERPRPLKAMVPADVRSSEDDASTGNRISFVFLELPCDEPDPLARLEAIHRATAERRRDGDAETLDSAFGVLALAPRTLQRALAHAFAHPRLSNLTISSVPGPAVARYMRGCRLATVHSAVPLAERHALSIGIVMAARNACFGIQADAEALPDADALGADVGAALDELIACTGAATGAA